MSIETRIEGETAIISIHRPERHNAMDRKHWIALTEAVNRAQADENNKSLIVTGSSEGHFCAGADISEMHAALNQGDWSEDNQNIIRACQSSLAEGPKPIIAAIDGDAIGGGCGIAVACDMRFASPRSRFGITPAKLGIVYSLYDTKLVSDLVGPAWTRQLLFTGDIVTAEESLRIGLINEIVENPMDHTLQLCAKMNQNSQHSIRNSKVIIRSITNGQSDDSPEQLSIFREAFQRNEFRKRVDSFTNRKK